MLFPVLEFGFGKPVRPRSDDVWAKSNPKSKAGKQPY